MSAAEDSDGGDLVAVVVPALDEAASIGGVVAGLLDQDLTLVVVVDNGSTDSTARVAATAGARVVDETRRGYGYACAAGSKVALASGADVLVYIDGDQSSRPDEIDRLLEPVLAGCADLVQGSRVTGRTERGAMAAHQRFGNRLAAGLIRRLYRLPITDLGPYRAIRSDLFRRLEMTEMTFGWPTEMTVKAARSGARILEVPVTWQPRHGGRSKVSGTVRGSSLAAYHIVRVILAQVRHRPASPERRAGPSSR